MSTIFNYSGPAQLIYDDGNVVHVRCSLAESKDVRSDWSGSGTASKPPKSEEVRVRLPDGREGNARITVTAVRSGKAKLSILGSGPPPTINKRREFWTNKRIGLSALFVAVLALVAAFVAPWQIFWKQEEATKPDIKLQAWVYGLFEPDEVPGTSSSRVKAQPPFACASDWLVGVRNSGRSPMSVTGARPWRANQPFVLDGSAQTDPIPLDIAWFSYDGNHIGNQIPAVVVPPGEYRYAMIRLTSMSSNGCILAQFYLYNTDGAVIPFAPISAEDPDLTPMRDKVFFSCPEGPLSCK